MSKTVKWILIVVGILIFLGLIIWLVLSIQPSTPQVIYQPGSGPTSEPCVPFTQGQYDAAVKGCQGKCNAQLAVPVAGVFLYGKCISNCKSQINNGKGIVMC